MCGFTPGYSYGSFVDLCYVIRMAQVCQGVMYALFIVVCVKGTDNRAERVSK